MRMKSNFIKIGIITLLLSIMSVFSVFASPKNAKSGKYYWEYVDGEWSCYNRLGAAVTGWIIYEDDIYYLNEDGVMETGWIKADKNWYYLDDSTGALVTDSMVDNYKVDSQGRMVKIN